MHTLGEHVGVVSGFGERSPRIQYTCSKPRWCYHSLAAISPVVLEALCSILLLLSYHCGGLPDTLGLAVLESACRYLVIICCLALRLIRHLYAYEVNDRKSHR